MKFILNQADIYLAAPSTAVAFCIIGLLCLTTLLRKRAKNREALGDLKLKMPKRSNHQVQVMKEVAKSQLEQMASNEAGCAFNRIKLLCGCPELHCKVQVPDSKGTIDTEFTGVVRNTDIGADSYLGYAVWAEVRILNSQKITWVTVYCCDGASKQDLLVAKAFKEVCADNLWRVSDGKSTDQPKHSEVLALDLWEVSTDRETFLVGGESPL